MGNLEEIIRTTGNVVLGGIVAAGAALGADYLLQNQSSGFTDLAQIGIGAAWAHYSLKNIATHFSRGRAERAPQNTLFDKVTNALTFPALTAATYFSGNGKAHELASKLGSVVTDLFPKTAAPELTNFTSDLSEAGAYAALAGTTLYTLNKWVVPAALKAKDRLKGRLKASGRKVGAAVVSLGTAALIAMGGYSANKVKGNFGAKSDSGFCGVATEGTPEQRALLDTIAWAEGVKPGEMGYRTNYGGGTFSSFKDHPRKKVRKWGITSSAAGRYQFMPKTHDGLKKKGYFSSGFYPSEQDKAALKLIRDEGVTKKILHNAIKNKTFKPIAKRINNIWAPIPGNTYGQGMKSIPSLNNKLQECYKVQKGGLLSKAVDYLKKVVS